LYFSKATQLVAEAVGASTRCPNSMYTEVQSTSRLADKIDASPPHRSRAFAKAIFFASKLLVSAACFWYVLRQINVSESIRSLPTFDVRWAALAVLVAMAEIPLVALRLWAVVQVLAPKSARFTYLAASAVAAIYALFAQVVPSVLGEGIRAWMLTRFGCGWRAGLTSVMIDRAVGVAVLLAFAFIILLLPSALTALSGYRNLTLFAFGAALIAGALALFATPRIAPLLQRWRYSYWIGTFAADAHRVLLGPRAPIMFGAACLIHAFTIIVIWSVGHAQGVVLPVFDCAVLFIVMVGVALVPISVGGWGLRELAVVSLLGAHGLAPERALIFSVCFGLVAMIRVLPGLIVWLLYPLPRAAAGDAGR
jgi:glycosyltransferase 2 family protein